MCMRCFMNVYDVYDIYVVFCVHFYVHVVIVDMSCVWHVEKRSRLASQILHDLQV